MWLVPYIHVSYEKNTILAWIQWLNMEEHMFNTCREAKSYLYHNPEKQLQKIFDIYRTFTIWLDLKTKICRNNGVDHVLNWFCELKISPIPSRKIYMAACSLLANVAKE